jgi:hypothetical protein
MKTIVAFALLLLPAIAFGQTADDSARAEKLFNEASALIEKGSYEDACPKLEESQRLDPALGTQFNLALCYEKTGKLARAWRNFREVERLAHSTGKKGREDVAREKLAAMRPLVAHLTITTKEDVLVKVDGEQVAKDDFGFWVVDVGEHAIDASASAKRPWQTKVNVPANPGAEIRVDIPALAVAVGETRVVKVETSNTRRTMGFVVAGVGLLGVAGAITTGAMVLDARATADRDCTPQCATQNGRDAVSLGKVLLPLNAIAWGVGIAGIGVGLAMVLWPSARKERSTVFTPIVSESFAGLSVSGRF